MPERRFTENIRHYPLTRGVGISQPALETDDRLFFLPYDNENYYLSFVISSNFDSIRQITTFAERLSVLTVVTSLMKF